MKTHDDVYRKLQNEINKMPVSFSATASGAELRLLADLFSPVEAEIAAHLNILSESLSLIHKRILKSGIVIDELALERVLDGLVCKGAIAGGRLFESKGGGKQYSLMQLALGMFELQVNQLTSNFVEHFEQYAREQFHKDVFSGKTKQMRTIPISQAVTPDMYIAPYDDIRKYVASMREEICVADCVCRQAAEIAGGSPRRSDLRETCLVFGNLARFYAGSGSGRPIACEEALSILDKAEKAGFILQPENAQKPKFICCCCADCCHELKMLKMHPRPADVFVSGYYAAIDPSNCNGCAQCVDLCGMEAITIESGIAEINRGRCIGCGVCVANCPENADRLFKKANIRKPPKSPDIMYAKIMIERFGLVRTLKTVVNVLAGRKA